MNLKQRTIRIALVMAAILTPFSQAGPTGYGTDRHAEEFSDFFGALLYGPRIDPLWDARTDTPNLQEMDRRIHVVQTFLGPAGADLVDLREQLALGMTRREYELSAFFTVKEISKYVTEFEHPPRFYGGYIGGDQVKYALRWLDSKAVIGLYYFAPPNGQGVDHYAMLEGHNARSGRLYFEEYDGATMSGEIFLRKRLTNDTINWEGERRGSDARRASAMMWRRRSAYGE